MRAIETTEAVPSPRPAPCSICEFAKAMVEVGDGVECIGQLDIENDFIWEQHGDGPMQAFCGVDANGENHPGKPEQCKHSTVALCASQ